MYEKIPQQLKDLDQWVCWKKVIDEEKNRVKKLPMNPMTGQAARSNDPTTWASFADAIVGVSQYHMDGIGIMFANGIVGIDLDHCLEDGTTHPIATDIIGAIRSYTETSPSGTGIHILCLGTLPAGRRRKDAGTDNPVGIEMYNEGRFFTVTGATWGNEFTFGDCTERIAEVHKKYLGENKKPLVSSTPQCHFDNNTYSMSVDDIIRRATEAKGGKKFSDLYHGDWSAYQLGDGSQSGADQAFCNILAFWCQKDAGLMDAVFRQSSLFRKKWDQNRGSMTYGQKTIHSAIDYCNEIWTPPAQNKKEGRSFPPPAPPIGNSEPPPIEAKPLRINPLDYKMDDTGNAYRLRDENLGDLKFNHIDGNWMFWDGRRWATDETGEIKRRADTMLGRMQSNLEDIPDEMENSYKKHITRSRSHKGKEAFIAECKHLDGIPILTAQLDRKVSAFNVQNKLISLKTGVARPHQREFLISKIANAMYNQDARCPLWEKTLKGITCGDTSLELYLQRMVGYCLTASTREQCVFFLYGNGSNGKSTFVDTISAMMGEYAATCKAEELMIKDNNSGRSPFARLNGSRMVVAAEAKEGCHLNESMIKQMAGGTDNKLVAHFIYGKEFEFIPTFKLVMTTNHKPVIKGTDDGIWRRIKAIPFLARFSDEEKDVNLIDKLKKEYAGILNWAIKGAVDWYEFGLPPCPPIDEACQEYRSEMDKTQQFIDDCLTTEKESTVQASKLYSVYQAWCKDRGDRYPMSSQRFFGDMKKRYKVKKTSAYNEYLDISFTEAGYRFSTVVSFNNS